MLRYSLNINRLYTIDLKKQNKKLLDKYVKIIKWRQQHGLRHARCIKHVLAKDTY